jgi:hypothetical protein
MTTRQQIEMLAGDFSPESLSVYADLLMSEGDPRGELIAIGLQQPTPELTERARVLVDLLLGDDRAFFNSHGSIDGGFVALWLPEDASRAQRFLDGPLGAQLRKVTITGPARHIVDGIELLATRTHRWLETLHVNLQRFVVRPVARRARARTDDSRADPQPPIIDDELAAALIAATPRLETLRVNVVPPPEFGHRRTRVFADFPHPNVRTLQL